MEDNLVDIRHREEGSHPHGLRISSHQSSNCLPTLRIDALGCPEVRIERIGTQVVANTMGRVAMLAADVDDNLPTMVPVFSGLNGNTESTMPIPTLVDVLFVSHSILDLNGCVVQESMEVDV